ncbi:mechanosensitive ion channel domain-containing protein [Albibacillus kandeliae]|uniref:mechanosensitive ion channel domain-containing protein n=1 Tax=Albibacillus kandeliae TaxID=2174228 RepID=UPI000D68A531|nr:mechanosensitive ion channel family protein [Albibacillus kandeliae]
MRLLFLLACLCLPLASVAQTTSAPAPSTTGAQPDGSIAVEDSAAQDAAIATRLRAILAGLEGYDHVTVTVASGIVTLRGTTLDSASATRLNDIASRVEGVVAIRNELAETTDVVERLNPALQRFRGRVLQFVAFLPLLSIALAAFALICALGFWIASWRNPWERIAPNAFIAEIYRQVLRIGFVLGGVVAALDILGATALLSTILGAAGIVGLAIGFAVRDTVENFIASILLSIRQPFRPNDTVEIEGDQGKVVRLTSRATILLSYDGNQIRIPNATVFKARIVNFTRNDERRFLVDLGVAPDADLAAAQALALDVVSALPFVLKEPAPLAWIETIGDSTITIRVAAWISQAETSFVLARSEAIRLLLAAFTEAGIDMPEPGLRLLGLTPPDSPVTLPQAPAATADRPHPAPHAAAPDLHAEATDVTARPEAALERIAEAERQIGEDQDLLNKSAPSE